MLTKIYTLFVSLSYTIVSLLSSFFNKNKFNNDTKALWQPPSYLFGIVWPLLYAMLFLMNYMILSSDVSKTIKNIISRDTLIEATLQGFWLYNFRSSDTYPHVYFISMLLLFALVLFAFYRLNTFVSLINYKYILLYIPYFLWINFANILNIQLFLGITK